ncbi:protein-L-isoaspartate(D-aspartate) O-methyltransferase [Comamonas sp. BIGb0124]|uniref:protein-L-isoaspartate O-methyltransferase family protein n=1 Tax=Comamonas sp. BIGb0124 TaxID=2485130 RepID=UPI000F4AF0BA|nr:protein-L-isoaspartate O-methyltransferase [Comamonas sp. BIGb0124]ROR24305.1 protein-L-isoaspartate(D-aspartate) O-methyltransferase [Comamonas sp. BIGb0124]
MTTLQELPPLEQARYYMVEQQIRPWDVHDERVLALLLSIRRENYVPAEHRSLAFVDMELPIGYGEVMLAPRVEARLLQDLDVKPTDRILEIGAGTGFMAALLAGLGQSVLSLELHQPLAELAQRNLQANGVVNAEVRCADGSKAAAIEGQFDVIVLSGSVAKLPLDLIEKLAPGGRLAAIVGDSIMMRATIVTRSVDTPQASTRQPWDTIAPRLVGFVEPSRFQF